LLRLIFVLFLLITPAFAQVTEAPLDDEGLVDQLTPDSLKLEADAVAKPGAFSETVISYQITNNSGMNLVMDIADGSISIGACPTLGTSSGSLNPFTHEAITVMAGGTVSGALTFYGCEAPNPGFPTAKFSMMLLLAKSKKSRTMADFPISIDAPVRQVQQ
jgi:hypothetical protein